MSKKKLNTSAVLNELKGQSAFFEKTKSPTKAQKKNSSSPLPRQNQEKSRESKSNEGTKVLVFERTSERTNVRKVIVERQKIRHAFDIFEDQLRELHTRQLEAVRAGKKKPGLGEMVQQALDEYISKGREMKHEEKRTSERTDEPSDKRTNDQI